MMKRSLMVMILIAAAVVSVSQADSYYELYSWETIVDDNSSASHFSAVADGGDTYHLLSLNSSPAITKVAEDGTVTTLVSSTDWAVATSGGTAMTCLYSLSVSGDNLIFGDSSSDAIWSVNKTTGAISALASSSAIDSYIGGTSPSILSGQDSYGGNFYFYEGDTDSVLKVSSSGSISTFVSDSQLTSVAGNDKVTGGITFTSAGNMIWGSSSSDGVYIWNASEESGSELLSVSDIVSVTGYSKGTASFGDFLYAEDGLVYFYESYSDNILCFDPDDAAATLEIVLSEAELLAGPAGSDNVYSLSWYNGNLAFNVNGENGYYVIPEPMTLALLGFGGLVLRRRKANK